MSATRLLLIPRKGETSRGFGQKTFCLWLYFLPFVFVSCLFLVANFLLFSPTWEDWTPLWNWWPDMGLVVAEGWEYKTAEEFLLATRMVQLGCLKKSSAKSSNIVSLICLKFKIIYKRFGKRQQFFRFFLSDPFPYWLTSKQSSHHGNVLLQVRAWELLHCVHLYLYYAMFFVLMLVLSATSDWCVKIATGSQDGTAGENAKPVEILNKKRTKHCLLRLFPVKLTFLKVFFFLNILWIIWIWQCTEMTHP